MNQIPQEPDEEIRRVWDWWGVWLALHEPHVPVVVYRKAKVALPLVLAPLLSGCAERITKEALNIVF